MKHLQLMLGSVMLFGLTACQTPKVATQEQQQKTVAHSLQVDGKICLKFVAEQCQNISFNLIIRRNYGNHLG